MSYIFTYTGFVFIVRLLRNTSVVGHKSVVSIIQIIGLQRPEIKEMKFHLQGEVLLEERDFRLVNNVQYSYAIIPLILAQTQ